MGQCSFTFLTDRAWISLHGGIIYYDTIEYGIMPPGLHVILRNTAWTVIIEPDIGSDVLIRKKLFDMRYNQGHQYMISLWTMIQLNATWYLGT